MTQAQRTALGTTSWVRDVRLALAAWLGVHSLMAIMTLSRVSVPAASLAGLALCLVAAAWVQNRTLVGRSLGAAAAGAVAGTVVAVGALVTPFLSGDDLRQYPTWWPGAVAPLLVCLVWTRHSRLAVVAAVAGSVLLVSAILLDRGSASPGDWVSPIAICVPLLPAVVVAYGVRTIFDQAARALLEASQAEEQSLLQVAQATARSRIAAQRRDELERTATPVLRSLTQPGGRVRPELAAACRQVESELRDSLVARALLDSGLRAALSTARQRGVRVTLTDDRGDTEPDDFSTAVAALLVRVLAAMDSGEVHGRLAPADRVATIVVQAPPEQLAAVYSGFVSGTENWTAETDSSGTGVAGPSRSSDFGAVIVQADVNEDLLFIQIGSAAGKPAPVSSS